MRTRFRKPLLYPLSYGGLSAQPCDSSRLVLRQLYRARSLHPDRVSAPPRAGISCRTGRVVCRHTWARGSPTVRRTSTEGARPMAARDVLPIPDAPFEGELPFDA